MGGESVLPMGKAAFRVLPPPSPDIFFYPMFSFIYEVGATHSLSVEDLEWLFSEFSPSYISSVTFGHAHITL